MRIRPENVRIATPADDDAVYDILLKLEADNGFGVPIAESKIKAHIAAGTRTDVREGVIGVIDGDGELAASIGLFHGGYWYSDETLMIEHWLFVVPVYRGSGYERSLFDFAHWAREALSDALQTHVALLTSVSSPKRLEAKERLWRRLSGGRRVGGIFVVD